MAQTVRRQSRGRRASPARVWAGPESSALKKRKMDGQWKREGRRGGRSRSLRRPCEDPRRRRTRNAVTALRSQWKPGILGLSVMKRSREARGTHGEVVRVAVERLGVRQRPVHRPTPRLVFAPDEAFNLAARVQRYQRSACASLGSVDSLVGRNMARLEVLLPVDVCALVAPPLDVGDLLRRPRVEVDRLDAGDVHTQGAMNARTADADEDSEVCTGPARVCRSVTTRISERFWRDNDGRER